VAFVDLVLSEEPIDGLLLVCAYREDDVDETHPLAAALSRWRELTAVRHLRLANLCGPSFSALVREILHAEPSAAAALVTLIEPQTHGNPYETVELLDGLRRDGLMAATTGGWRWNQTAVGAHLGRSDLASLLAGRVEAMPPSARDMIEAMGCLGGRAERRMLQVATATQEDAMDRALAPAIEDGVLVLEPGRHEAVQFRHDRIREAVLERIDAEQRRALQLAMARRLASVPQVFAVAAEQYLPVVDAIDDPGEKRQVVSLLRRAADQAALTGDYGRVNSLLTAALRLVGATDHRMLVEMHTGRHSALFNLGRLEEADDEYRTIIGLAPGASARRATAVQVRSLTHRNRFAEAIELGLRSLRDCGITVPAEERRLGEIDAAFAAVHQWLQDTDVADDLARPDISDPALITAGTLIIAMMPATYFTGDHVLLGWLTLETLRVWIKHGPGRSLVGPAFHFAHAAMELRGDYAVGYQALRRLLTVSEARGYEPDTSLALHCFITSARFWFEPIENNVADARRARDGLIAGGDLHIAGHTFAPATTALIESAPSLEAASAEVKAGLDFARRTGGEQTAQWLDGYRWLTDALRGESSGEADAVAPDDKHADNPMALFYAHVNRAVAAAVFGDPQSLERHTSSAITLLPAVSGHYETAWARLLRGLAVADQARDAEDGEERRRLLSELDDGTRWLAARAADAPENFGHLVLWLDAERAWAVGDFRAASLAFDAARRELSQRSRPWHEALITERSARFFLAHGLGHLGEELLADARRQYLAWGAMAKVDQLDWAYPILRDQPKTTTGDDADGPSHLAAHRSSITTGTIDLLGILSASQALSSETSIERLRSRVIELLGAMTGATGGHLVVWSEDRQAWLAPTPDGSSATVLVGYTERESAVPMTVLRYAQRVQEPLIVSDATMDDRFARDPYFAGLDSCSLLSVPILSRGTLQGVLLLENRLIRGAFSAERLDAVKLIAGQLAVSLDNAHLYAELADSRARLAKASDTERRKLERDLHDGAQQRLVAAMITLALVRDQAEERPELHATLSEVEAELEQALQELRELAHGLYPTELTRSGLSGAIRALAERSGGNIVPGDAVDRRFPPEIEAALYYCCLEAVQNASKHAGSQAQTSIRLFTDAHGLHLEVRDDGAGFDPDDVRDGVGLKNMCDRLGAVGGWVEIDSEPGRGTLIAAAVPLTGAS
jgi:signal transduction histidine kinase